MVGTVLLYWRMLGFHSVDYGIAADPVVDIVDAAMRRANAKASLLSEAELAMLNSLEDA